MERPKQLPCDQCHERRVRCRDRGVGACEACFSARLDCTRTLVRKKRGPKKAGATGRHEEIRPGVGNSGGADRASSETRGLQQLVSSEATSPEQLHRGVLQTKPVGSSEQLVTVSELADFVLDRISSDHFHNVPGNGAASANLTPLSPSNDSGRALSLTTPPQSTPEISSRQTSGTPNQISSPKVLFKISDSKSGSPPILDPASLAIAVGLPVRYGPLIIESIDIYFRRLHNPITVVHEQSLRNLLAQPSQLNQVQRCFVLAFSAAAILREACKSGEDIDEDIREKGCRFLEQCFTLRANIDFIEQQTPLAVTMSYFIHLSYACLQKVKSSGHFLREAISFGMGLSLHEREQAQNTDDADLICARRTLALLSVTERAMAVLIDVPAVLLRSPPQLPGVFFDKEDGDTLIAFGCLYSLFSLMNAEILDYWSSGRLEHERHRETLRINIEAAQHDLATRTFHGKPLTDIQRADILVTQQWLRLILWQISNRLSLLSTQSTNPSFTYDYPILIARDLCMVLETLTEDSLRAHHFSIYCKIFEVAYSLMDILFLAKRQRDAAGSHELRVLFSILAKSPVVTLGFSKILMEKTMTQD